MEQNWDMRNSSRTIMRKADKTPDKQTERDLVIEPDKEVRKTRQRKADRQTDKQASRQTDKQEHRDGHADTEAEAEAQSQTQRHPRTKHQESQKKTPSAGRQQTERQRSNNKQADRQASTEGHRGLADGREKPTNVQMYNQARKKARRGEQMRTDEETEGRLADAADVTQIKRSRASSLERRRQSSTEIQDYTTRHTKH